MATISKKGAEEARNQLPGLLDAAEHGQATVITKHGKAVAALVPIEDFSAAGKQAPLLKLKGSGRGLWGADSSRAIKTLRDEWDR